MKSLGVENPSSLKFRPAKWDDLNDVFRIERESKPELYWPRSWFENEMIREYGRFFVLETGSRIGGFCVWWQTDVSLEILNVAVAPELQRRGFGGLMFDEVIAQGRGNHIPAIDLELRRDNDSALGFYKSLGFIEVGKRRAYYRDGMDAVLMRMEL